VRAHLGSLVVLTLAAAATTTLVAAAPNTPPQSRSLARIVRAVTDPQSIGPGQSSGVRVPCPQGTHVIGGGVTPHTNSALYVCMSAPSPTNEWFVRLYNPSTLHDTYIAEAICGA
jgi:hypothetical protein